MNPRQLAFTLLQKAEKSDQYSNIVLDHALSDSDLNEADRRLCATLFYGVTERRLTLDYQLARLSARTPQSLDRAVLTALRIGLYQLLYLDRIPPHAAINESVKLVPRKSAGYVNAVLRAYTRDPGLRLPDRDSDPETYLSVTYSVCPPLCRKLTDCFGRKRAEAILKAFGNTPPTTLRVNTRAISRDALASRIPDAVPTAFSPVGLQVRGAVRELYGFDDGLFFVQDEASQLCVEALAAEEGDTVMDICACPGSKSFGSAIRMNDRGRIFSYDLHEKKLPLIVSGAARLGITIITPSVCDGRVPIPALEGKADRVLCDVPCSGFGVLAKKPELRYKDPTVSEGLPAIQAAILENSCRYVRKGGRLVYSTCTIFPEENEENIRRFLTRHPEFSLTPFTAGALQVKEGMVTLLPDVMPTDGFFIAVMTRKDD